MSFISFKEKRFGRNGIYWPAFIHLVCLYLFIWGGHWGAYVAGGVVIGALWVASFIDWRNLQKIDHKHPNNHFADVAEGSDPPTMKDGGPIRDFVKWYAVQHGPPGKNHPLKEAEFILQHMPTWRRNELREEHRLYVALDKFKNYPRP